MEKIVDEGGVVTLDVMHGAAHARKAFAESQIISGICFRCLAFGPIPISAILQINDENGVTRHDGTATLDAEIVHATNRLLENLRTHDRRTDGENNAAVESLDRCAEKAEIDSCGTTNHSAVEHRMIGN